ncbi:aromatic amino acid lyase [Pseudonocardia sp. UM4_GMWB1]|jgi:phenylalanine ammonia-lyase|uniref:HAL/PAL/TAL family ammonia-lyase n=1 Tax=Pseudonocardia sp. UM4_GMWB1 TaxID=2212989 RepID=UPI00307E4B98
MTGPAQGGPLRIGAGPLDLDVVVGAARRAGTRCELDATALDRMHRSRRTKLDALANDIPIYGVTTGFGDSANRQIAPRRAARLQENLIRCHLNGTGPAAPPDVVRATMLIRANSLARGVSAINPAVVERLLDLLAHDVLPVVPQRGSVGASGDLVPLSHVAAALLGEGEVDRDGDRAPAVDALAAAGIPISEPEAKDGLALINGTSFSTAVAVLTLAEAERFAEVAEIATATAIEAVRGNRGHHAAFLHAQKPHPGQVRAAARITELLDGSRLALDHTQLLAKNPPLGDAAVVDLDRAIQDRYSLRCAPHVIGVLHDTTEWVRRWLTVEVNSANDNPLFDPDSADVYSGGNFYGGHVAQAMDSLKVAVANVVDLLDRQIELMVDARFSNGLPSNLVRPDPDEDGLHHGFKGMQIAASAATAEALAGCMPAGVFSRSTESHNQDKVSMSAPAARSSRAVLEPASEVAAIHLLTACQAVDLRGPEQSSPACTRVRAVVRRECRFVDHDRALHRDVAAVQRMIADGQIPGAE